MTADRLAAQRRFRAQQRIAVADAQRLPVDQARERLRELANEERTFFEEQRLATRVPTCSRHRRGGRGDG